MSELWRALLLKQYPSSKSSRPMCALELPSSRHDTAPHRPQAILIQVNVLGIDVHVCSERPRQSRANNHFGLTRPDIDPRPLRVSLAERQKSGTVMRGGAHCSPSPWCLSSVRLYLTSADYAYRLAGNLTQLGTASAGADGDSCAWWLT